MKKYDVGNTIANLKMMFPQTLIRHDGTRFTTMRKATIWIVTRDGIQHHCTRESCMPVS